MRRLASVLFTFVFIALFSNPVQAGPKLKHLLRSIDQLKTATLLVPPILADPNILNKLQAKGDQEAIEAYLTNLRKANEYLRAFMVNEFEFCKVELLFDEPELRDYKSYFGFFNKYKKGDFFILQFGSAVQYATGSYKRIKKYEREFLGLYEPDGQTRVYLNAGKLKRMSSESYANSILSNLELNLDRFYKMAQKQKKKGKIRSKKKDVDAPDPEPIEQYPTAIDKDVIVVSRVKLYDRSDTLRFQDGYWRTVQVKKEIKLYSYFGGKVKLNGFFATTQPFQNLAEVQSKLGLLEEWGNTMQFLVEINVPAGTELQLGKVGPQPPHHPLLPGGADQVMFLQKWNLNWTNKITDTKSGKVYTLQEFQTAYPDL